MASLHIFCLFKNDFNCHDIDNVALPPSDRLPHLDSPVSTLTARKTPGTRGHGQLAASLCINCPLSAGVAADGQGEPVEAAGNGRSVKACLAWAQEAVVEAEPPGMTEKKKGLEARPPRLSPFHSTEHRGTARLPCPVHATKSSRFLSTLFPHVMHATWLYWGISQH